MIVDTQEKKSFINLDKKQMWDLDNFLFVLDTTFRNHLDYLPAYCDLFIVIFHQLIKFNRIAGLFCWSSVRSDKINNNTKKTFANIENILRR